ncbi:MAG TPA: hypothetical protein PLO84_11790, partial [Thermotogota bacterium]|nr:hypothetical protein [Thermotogota bacterium]
MRKRIILLLILVLLLFQSSFSAFDEESFSAWSQSIRKFSGMRNIAGCIDIGMDLIDKSGNWYKNEYAMDFYSRDLKDYRIDFTKPSMLKGITVLYQYREQLLYVLNIEAEEYALQSFESGSEMQFNPTVILMDFLDFLINIDTIPLLNVYPELDEAGCHVFRILLSQPDILLLFQKEYPAIIIRLNEENSIRQVELLNEDTDEKLVINLIDMQINLPGEKINAFFEIPLNEFKLIEYLG